MSKIEVNTVEPQCGTTLTLGGSGDTVALGSGASQTGFGRTGTVDWNTTKITADPANAVSGTGYFCDTSGGGFTVTLPTGPSAGDIVAVSDYTRTWNSNNLIVGRNSKPIGGVAADAVLVVDGQSATFVFVDDTEGWINTQETQTSQTGVPPYVAATGGCITCCGNFKIHTFLVPGTFTVTASGSPTGSNKVDYLVVAGGGGGANQHGGGGGAGGYRTSFPSPGCNAGTVTVTETGYPITVGGGGAKSPTTPSSGTTGVQGGSSIFDTFTSAGGGGGGAYTSTPGQAGGSGGGGGSDTGTGGAGNTPAIPVGVQGYAGGTGTAHYIPGGGGGGGGGGGAAAIGAGGAPSPLTPSGAGAGGAGAQNNIDTNNYYWGGGGGGGAHCSGLVGGNGGIGGAGGGGSGQGVAGTGGGSAINAGTGGTAGPPLCSSVGGAGGDNSGGGGGASGAAGANAGGGGSGIVIIRYKFQ